MFNSHTPDVKIIQPKVISEERGYSFECFREDIFNQGCVQSNFIQENHIRSFRGVLRGLHYQAKMTQGKLVRVTYGSVFDVDLRKGSSSFGKWVRIHLSDENHKELWIPEGFAQGFYVTSEIADFTYKCTNYYAPEYEYSILWNDPDLRISWLLATGEHPKISDKDRNAGYFRDAKYFKC
ncbi:dTDP-4-dehydrorhamnose 3,5-epimerase [Microbulbifer epialgicus]|uniref:dTDP-4-dehydrorhamnose 3,5-epimerase n=1 Tax=Microbulbifer epialgicus TaxID=393907 RepID=A0ABV4P5W7_9GAMM